MCVRPHRHEKAMPRRRGHVERGGELEGGAVEGALDKPRGHCREHDGEGHPEDQQGPARAPCAPPPPPPPEPRLDACFVVEGRWNGGGRGGGGKGGRGRMVEGTKKPTRPKGFGLHVNVRSFEAGRKWECGGGLLMREHSRGEGARGREKKTSSSVDPFVLVVRGALREVAHASWSSMRISGDIEL